MNQQKRKEIAMEFFNNAFGHYPEWIGKVDEGSPSSLGLHSTEKSVINLSPATYPETLANVDISPKQIKQIGFDPIVLSIICGTVLGDAFLILDENYANARIGLKHSTRQYQWFMWKMFVILKDYCNTTGLIYLKPDGYQKASPLRPGEKYLGKLQINSKVDKKFTALHKIICEGKRTKVIKRSWLNHMNSYFLMTLWLDDGSLYNGRQGRLSLQSIPAEQQDTLRKYLHAVWGIRTKREEAGVMKNGKMGYYIEIADQENLLKFLRLVAPIIPVHEMLYKVCFVPHNNEVLLQRWKSELISLVRPKFQNFVIQIYNEIAEERGYPKKYSD
jgi:hypothetical protein